MRFEFATAQRIVFGPGCLKELGPLAASLGRRALLAVGMDPARGHEAAIDLLSQAGLETVDRQGARASRRRTSWPPALPWREISGCDLVVGFGGGSSMDTAKAVAALVANGGEPLDYLEVVGRGKALTQPSLPVIAIPTTAGAGAEVTRNAVLLSPEHGIKASLRSPTMLPRVALVDPELTLSLPPDVTASTGLDALTQLIEPFTSSRANPHDRRLLPRGHGCRAARSLRRAYEHGDDIAAREDMSLASLVRRLEPGQRRPGRRAWVRGSRRRPVPRAARRGLCGAPASRYV